MSINGGISRSSGRSSSSTRSSRRATMSIGPGGGLSSGSLSPQRVLRTRASRERINDGNVHHSITDATVAGKAKVAPKVAPKGATRTQQMQFAFGSKVLKPASSSANTGMTSAPGEARGKAHGGTVADASNALAWSRRERTVKHEPHEQQRVVSSRGRRETQTQHLPPPTAATRTETDAAVLKTQVEERESIVTELRSKLEKGSAQGKDVSGRKNAQTTRVTAKKLKANAGDNGGQQQQQKQLGGLDEGARAALKAVEEEALADAEEALMEAETATAAGLSKTEEMQARVDEIIRQLKARRQ